jgi:hypothetical protein
MVEGLFIEWAYRLLKATIPLISGNCVNSSIKRLKWGGARFIVLAKLCEVSLMIEFGLRSGKERMGQGGRRHYAEF